MVYIVYVMLLRSIGVYYSPPVSEEHNTLHVCTQKLHVWGIYSWCTTCTDV